VSAAAGGRGRPRRLWWRPEREPGAHHRALRHPRPTPQPQTRSCSEAQLKAVKVDKADVDALAAEFDLPRPVAERQLRIAGGDLRAAMRALMGVPAAAAAR
jgi:hypothetical protein